MDSPNGKLPGTSEFIGESGAGLGSKVPSINLVPSEGFHDFYLVFTNPENKGGASLMILANTTFISESVVTPEKTENVNISPNFNVYAGKYKMTGLPFEYIVVTLKNGKLMIDANGEVGELKPTPAPDAFDSDWKATITFLKDEKQVFTKLKIEAMDFNFDGIRE